MDFGYLKAFSVVVETGSISQAAKKLYVSQPALSIKIKELENHYQEKLLERTNKGIKPTEIGMLVYTQAQKILSLSENIEKEIEKQRCPLRELLVGASSTIGSYALPCTVYNFQERYPDYKITLTIGNTSQIVENMIDRKIDIGTFEGPITPNIKEMLARECLRTRRIVTNELILVSACDERWQNVDKITLDELKKMPLIIREKGSGITATIETALKESGYCLNDFNVVLELHNTNSIVSAVSSGKGISLLPKMALRKELAHKILKKIEVEDIVFHHEFYSLYRVEETSSELHSIFLRFLQSKERGFC